MNTVRRKEESLSPHYKRVTLLRDKVQALQDSVGSLSRRTAVMTGALARLGGRPLGVRPAAAASALSAQQIEAKLAEVQVVALVNPEGAPFLLKGTPFARKGFFYLDPEEALRDFKQLRKTEPAARLQVTTLTEVYFPIVRGDKAQLGGEFLVRPDRREVVQANRVLSASVATRLDEDKGEVPLFYSTRVTFNVSGTLSFPFFLTMEDLESAYRLVEPKSGGIPVDLVDISTLDGLVQDMRAGEVDLSQAQLVPSRGSIKQFAQLVRQANDPVNLLELALS